MLITVFLYQAYDAIGMTVDLDDSYQYMIMHYCMENNIPIESIEDYHYDFDGDYFNEEYGCWLCNYIMYATIISKGVIKKISFDFEGA